MSTIIAPEDFTFEQKRKEALLREQVRALQVLDQILGPNGMNLVLTCPRCTATFGAPNDGVKIDAQPGDTTFHVTCNCTDRVLKLNPHPGTKPS